MENDDQTEKRGRGRPEGSMSKLAKEARERAQATGQLPHEILLDMARGNPQPLKKATMDLDGVIEMKITGWEVPNMDQRRDAAKAAAPYYAPKISTVEVISGASDDDLDQLIKQFATQAGVALAVGGEGETGSQSTGEGSSDSSSEGESERGRDAVIRRRPVTGTRP